MFNFFIFLTIMYIAIISNLKNNSIMYLSILELIWINVVVITIFLLNFYDNINFLIIILFIFTLASLELTIILLYIYIKK